MARWQRIHLPVQETQLLSLVWEDPLEEEMTPGETGIPLEWKPRSPLCSRVATGISGSSLGGLKGELSWLSVVGGWGNRGAGMLWIEGHRGIRAASSLNISKAGAPDALPEGGELLG